LGGGLNKIVKIKLSFVRCVTSTIAYSVGNDVLGSIG
jgi:hypothetical protein